jgi:hypothetical protein
MKKHLVAGAVLVAAVFGPSAAAMAAGGGYGPSPSTGPSGVPGGFTTVVTTKTVGPGGGSLTGLVAGAAFTIRVPAGAFGKPVEIEVTEPVLASTGAALGKLGYPGYRAVAGVGVKVLTTSGTPLQGSFAKPLTVTLRGSSLGVRGERVLGWVSADTVSVVRSTQSPGSASVQLTADPDLTVINPPASPSQASVPGATSVHTGLPFAGERDLGLALMLGGAGALAAAIRRRRAARR